MKQKLQTPPAQKRTPEYTGKRFKVDGGLVLPNGDLLIQRAELWPGARRLRAGGPQNGQQRHGSLVGGLGGLMSGKGGTSMATAANNRQYKDIMMFHFDPQGHLRAQYGVRRQENNKFSEQNPNEQHLTWRRTAAADTG